MGRVIDDPPHPANLKPQRLETRPSRIDTILYRSSGYREQVHDLDRHTL